MSLSLDTAVPSSTPTASLAADTSYDYGTLFGSSTSSSAVATFTGSDDYPVFPNGVYISKFFLVSALKSGITDLDIDLYNECYLPFNPLPYNDYSKRDGGGSDIQQPDYLIDEAPCKRAAAINSNCYFDNTNGTFQGLEPSEQWTVQQQCFCERYPYFDSTLGCMECFRLHGGIEGMFNQGA
jgi:hypothetical protein